VPYTANSLPFEVRLAKCAGACGGLGLVPDLVLSTSAMPSDTTSTDVNIQAVVVRKLEHTDDEDVERAVEVSNVRRRVRATT